MKDKLNIGFVLALTYVIMYIVIKIYLNPNFDHFTTHDSLSPEFSKSVEQKRKEMNAQMLEQYDQDKRIHSLKSKIDALRNDLKIIKSKEQEEMSSIYQQVTSDDSLASAMAVDGGKALNNMLGSRGSKRLGAARGGSKNYNLNFNLDDE